MTIQNFKQLVADMRTAQIDYFRTREQGELRLAKKLEERVDKALKEDITFEVTGVLHDRKQDNDQSKQGGLWPDHSALPHLPIGGPVKP